MKSASDVDLLVQAWIDQKKTKAEIIVNTAEAELGWPYVWGAVGAQCTPEKRKYYAQRSSCPAGEVTQIYKTCQYYNADGTPSGKYCGGCQYYPNNMRVLIDDCHVHRRRSDQHVEWIHELGEEGNKGHAAGDAVLHILAGER